MTKTKKSGVLFSSLAVGTVLTVVIAGCGNKSGTAGLPSGGGTVATVNGDSIDREALRDHLEATGGEGALRQLIDFSLVMQKAKAEGIEVSDAEVAASIADRAKTNPEIEAITKAGGVRLNALQRQTRYQLALDKLLTKDVKADEAAVQKWFETRRKYYDQPERVKIGFLLASTKARADTMAAQLKSKSKSFQELVTEQQKANDQLGQGSQAEGQTPILTSTLPPALKTAIAKLKEGETSTPQSLGQGAQQAYVIVRLIERQPAVKADFAKMKDQAIMDYKLEQVAKKLNGENPQNPPFEQTLDQVAAVVAQQSGGATPDFRAILTFINQTAASNLSNGLRTAAKVEVKDQSYAQVAESFKPVPGADAAATPAGGADKAPATPPAGDAKK